MATATSGPVADTTFRVVDLMGSDPLLDGEEELVREVRGFVDDVLAKLRPIMKYIAKPLAVVPATHDCQDCRNPELLSHHKRFRAIIVLDPSASTEAEGGLILTEDCEFIRVRRCRDGRIHEWVGETFAKEGFKLTWHYLQFDRFFNHLTVQLEDAERTRREHWEATKARTDLLRRLRDDLRGKLQQETK